MTLSLDLEDIQQQHAKLTGGKALSLSILLQKGFVVPDGLCILTDSYRRFVDTSPLAERIRLELSRKDFQHMRWEELWDTSLRIRNLFNQTPFPVDMAEQLTENIAAKLGGDPVAVRSSAIGEDSGELSFAGLHESILNVTGAENILKQVKRVWSSLWSDAALLYRQELGLEVESSAMAVMVQHFVPGDCSGVIFSQSPLDPDMAVLEAVSGLAKGLVDGEVEPERWNIDRRSGQVQSHVAPSEYRQVVADLGGVRTVHDSRQRDEPLLSNQQIQEVYTVVREAESLFGCPQDMEWTFGTGGLQILQSRPVTAKAEDAQEKRVWNLSLRRSFQNLSELREKIETVILPEMQEEADRLSKRTLKDLSDSDLAQEIGIRRSAVERWTGVYWDDLIPFAHGMRLFGQVYNDAVQPQDPFAFVALLRPDRLESLERNHKLHDMSEYIRRKPVLRNCLKQKPLSQCNDAILTAQLESYLEHYGNFLGIRVNREEQLTQLRILLFEMSDPSQTLNEEQETSNREDLELQYLACFEDADKEQAKELIELGRASYKIRDDDNIYWDRFKALLGQVEELGRERLKGRGVKHNALSADEIMRSLQDPGYRPKFEAHKKRADKHSDVNARQLLGQPAGHGIASGRARVILNPEDLFTLKKGEILVCDAIDPAMTFVVPLTAGIVERRGGMLIHGAIIAREYGIPCVTGIPDATARITTGDRLTVDGYLGIVVIDSRNAASPTV